jgi:hypothetical protein
VEGDDAEAAPVRLRLVPRTLHPGDEFAVDAPRDGPQVIFGAWGATLHGTGDQRTERWHLDTPWGGGSAPPSYERLPPPGSGSGVVVVPAIGLIGPRRFRLPLELPPGRYRLHVGAHLPGRRDSEGRPASPPDLLIEVVG